MSDVNLQQMASSLGCSTRALVRMVETHTDFPVLERGEQGRPWKFDAKAVARFLKTQNKKKKEAKPAKQAALQGLPPILTPRSAGTAGDQLKTLKSARWSVRKPRLTGGWSWLKRYLQR